MAVLVNPRSVQAGRGTRGDLPVLIAMGLIGRAHRIAFPTWRAFTYSC
jgi:hypothetical protein